MKKHATIHAAFVAAQTGFAPALKQSNNPHFKSRYADLATCVEAVLDALNENGIGLMQVTHPNTEGVEVETVLVHESGTTLSGGRLFVPAAKHDPQGYGSALTYARRYSLMATCGHAPEDDDGNAASAPRPAAPASRPAAPARFVSPSVSQTERIIADIRESKTLEELKKQYMDAIKAIDVGDDVAAIAITAAKDQRKKELTK
jgi:hypothetical protein